MFTLNILHSSLIDLMKFKNSKITLPMNSVHAMNFMEHGHIRNHAVYHTQCTSFLLVVNHLNATERPRVWQSAVWARQVKYLETQLIRHQRKPSGPIFLSQIPRLSSPLNSILKPPFSDSLRAIYSLSECDHPNISRTSNFWAELLR